MKIISILEDKRIKSTNVLIEFTIGEYLGIADQILHNNPFQRKKVKSSSTVYSLLRDDLKVGCVIPPIVLAITVGNISNIDIDDRPHAIENLIRREIHNIIILDGLQRTNNIIDADLELKSSKEFDVQKNYHQSKLRCEFYIGIDKIGILYRMLTLNTGQTPMSLRHQIEILYSDYLNHPINGIRLVKETDDRPVHGIGEYNFKDIIEGFTSYLMRDYLTFDKSDILTNIKSLEKLSKENQDADIFVSYTKCYNSFQFKISDLAGDWQFDSAENDLKLSGPAYGKNASAIFNKSQSMTALGAAVGFLKDKGIINNFNDIFFDINNIYFKSNADQALSELVYKLDDIRKNAPKIGNAQREYFFYFFRELFNRDGDSYLVIEDAIESGFRRYRQNA